MTAPGAYWDLCTTPMIANINKVFPDISIRQVPGASKESVTYIRDGKAEIGIGNADGYWGWFSLLDFKGQPPFRDIRTLFSLAAWPDMVETWVVMKDSPIKSTKDLFNKKIIPGTSTHTASRVGVPNMLALYGITYDSIKKNGGDVIYANTDVAVEMLASGQLDAVLNIASNPYGPITQLNLTRGIRLVGMTDQEIAVWADPIKGVPGTYGKGVLAANTYVGQTEPVAGVSPTPDYFVTSKMPDDVVYNLLWAIWGENRYQAWWQVMPSYKTVDMVSFMSQNPIVPFHPGSLRYFKDLGLKVPPSLTDTPPPTTK